jgi:CDP-diacylglycerol--glycerol-3-phosphate 3-phosphatidyltransferase
MNLSHIRKDAACYITSPLVKVLSKSKVTPNILTLGNLGLSIIAAYVIATGKLLVGGILVLVSGLFDILDGALARSTGQGTNFGAVLDSTVDRIAEAATLGGVLFWYLFQDNNLGVALSFAVAVGSLLVSYVRARAEGIGQECQVGWFTRAERVVVLAIGLILNQILIALCLLLVFVFLTVFQRMAHVRKQAKTRGAKWVS